MRNTTSRLLVSVLSLGCLASFALAQTGPAVPSVPSAPGAPGSPIGPGPALPAQIGQVLKMDGVVAYLKRLDPTMKQLSQNGGWTYYLFNLAGKGRSYKVVAAVNNGYIFLDCYLGQPIGSPGLSNDVMVRMLKLNTSIGPSYFHFAQVQGGLQLVLSHRIDVTVTPERFQAGLNEFLGDIINSEPLWSEALNSVAGQQPAPVAPGTPRS